MSRITFMLAALVGYSSARRYFSGEIKTHERYLYGKFRARIQGTGQKGTVQSLFTFWEGTEDNPWSREQWEEIDIELVPSKEDSTFFTNLITAWQAMDGAYHPNYEPGVEWHDYEIVWKPNEVYWTYDGVEVRRETNTKATRDLNKASALYMNFWTPQWDDWGGGRDDSTMPWYAKYDFVETYEYDQESDSFSLRWRDDFQGPLDMNRWRISDDWSFEQNSSTFVTEHVYTRDGNLILKMDKTKSPPEPTPPEPTPPEPSPPKPEPEPSPPEPEECEAAEVEIDADAIRFGNPCNIRHSRDACDCKMKECYQSWNASDPNGFLGQSGQCRCLPEDLKQSGELYTYGVYSRKGWEGQCRNQCKECRWSWPSDDQFKWKSDKLQARCMPALSIPDDSSWDYNHKDFADPYAEWKPQPGFVGGGSCKNLNDQTCGVSCTQCNWQWSQDETRADPWHSDSAKCRCVEKKSFNWGERCSSPSEGLCGDKCKDCFKATMVEDPTQTDCRCRNTEAQFYA